MITLSGNNLNRRHYELNKKVNEDAENNVDFKQIEFGSEHSDVDKLYKIDLASKYKNIDYILEVLKSGDSLYISRALKCDWIANDEYSHIFNPENLHANIFPHMSAKMKKKLIAKLVKCIRNCDRAEPFHHYCMRNKMLNFGMNFLLFTNESFKMEILELHPHVYNDFNREKDYLKHFIGSSFPLAQRYLKNIHESYLQFMVMYNLRSLFSVSQEQYLDLLESLEYVDCISFPTASLKFSKQIMKKHKKRVLRTPFLYLNILQETVVAKYSTSADAKTYAVAFLPKKHSCFWPDYFIKYKYFLELIPLGERFSFLKKIFCEKYPGNQFEDNESFYHGKFYEIMTAKEQEDWALSQIASGREIFGYGSDYIWYKFINFKTAFFELKKFILLAIDNEKRIDILKIMVESAKSHDDVTKLLDYYYNRHINESNQHIRRFIDMIIQNHKIVHFSEACWDALEKIFYSLKVFYNLSNDKFDRENWRYIVLVLIYKTIHEKPVPEEFKDFILNNIFMTNYTLQEYLESDGDIDQKKQDLIFNFMLRVYTEQVGTLWKAKNNNIDEVQYLISEILDLIDYFKKTRDTIPAAINKIIMANLDIFIDHIIFAHLYKEPVRGIKDFRHYLKTDASLVVSEFFTIKKYIQEREFRLKINLNWLTRKLQLYFFHDLAPMYKNLLRECLAAKELNLNMAQIAVYGILNLSNELSKIEFLSKYVPEDGKIDHVNICRNHLTIQTAICSIACKARPPLPMANIREFIKGDYLKFSLPLFDSYMANLTPLQCVTFVESLLDNPVSVHKHGLRLAFGCFSTKNLKNLVLKVWKTMKNVSLRKVLYKYLFDKINYYHDNLIEQWELFEALTIITHDLHQDDDEEIFNLLTKRLPPNMFGQHLQSAYTIVNTFHKKPKIYHLMTNIIRAIESNLDLMSNYFLLAVMEKHVSIGVLQHLNTDYKDLVEANWSLIKTYALRRVELHILYLIMDRCFDKWHETYDGIYAYRKFWSQFLCDLEYLSYGEPANRYKDINDIFTTIENEMVEKIPLREIYVLTWELRANIVTRQVLGENVPNIINVEMDKNMREILITETIVEFSKEIGNLLKKIIENHQYVSPLKSVIYNVICSKVSYVRQHFSSYRTYDDIMVLLCNGLLSEDQREIENFVMESIPSNYDGIYSNEYKDVVNKLKSLDDNTDIEFFMWHKFHCSDYVCRDFMP